MKVGLAKMTEAAGQSKPSTTLCPLFRCHTLVITLCPLSAYKYSSQFSFLSLLCSVLQPIRIERPFKSNIVLNFQRESECSSNNYIF